MKKLLLVFTSIPYLVQATGAATTAATGVALHVAQPSVTTVVDKAELKLRACRFMASAMKSDLGLYRDRVLHQTRPAHSFFSEKCLKECFPVITNALFNELDNIESLSGDEDIDAVVARRMAYARSALAYYDFCKATQKQDSKIYDSKINKLILDIRNRVPLSNLSYIVQMLKTPFMPQISLFNNELGARIVTRLENDSVSLCVSQFFDAQPVLLEELRPIVLGYALGHQYWELEDFMDVWSVGEYETSLSLDSLSSLRGIRKLGKTRVTSLCFRNCALTHIPDETQLVFPDLTELKFAGNQSANDLSKFPCERFFTLFPKLDTLLLDGCNALITPKLGQIMLERVQSSKKLTISFLGCTTFPKAFDFLKDWKVNSYRGLTLKDLPQVVELERFDALFAQQELACGLVDATTSAAASDVSTTTTTASIPQS
jgi:hypothetical protein